MISGHFTSYAISKIQVNRQSRQRKALDQSDIDSLAESIGRLGLIHPIVITRSGELVAGERRLRAHQHLGLSDINVQFTDDLDEVALKQIELEENIKRVDITWQEQCLALAELHEIHRERNPSWTQDDTAKEIGYALRTVEVQLQVARELHAGNEQVAKADRFSTARGIVIRKNERAQADELQMLKLPVKGMASVPGTRARQEPEVILNEDFNEWIQTYEGLPFNFIHCDFPYGIGADKFDQSAAHALGGYEDTEEVYWRLLDSLLANRNRLLGDSGHVLFWFSMKHYQRTLERLRSAFWVDEYPLIWSKVGQGTLPNPEMGPRRTYEVAFLCSHGSRKIVRAVSNLQTFPIERAGDHMSEKSQRMLEEFFRMLVDPSTRMLDPTCGSGSALRAADAIGAKSVLGLEVNPEFCKLARLAWGKRNG